MLDYLFYISIYVFSGLLKSYKYLLGIPNNFVPSEDSTSLHSYILLSRLIRCADWCDSPLSQQVIFVGQLLCTGSYDIT